jgi:hypothetical protein
MKEHDRRRTSSGTDDSGSETFFPVPSIKEVEVVVPRQSIGTMTMTMTIQSAPSFMGAMIPIVPVKSHSALNGRVVSVKWEKRSKG